jgi:predicted NAD/FAD-binding protein
MSFAASIDDGRIEYCGDSLNTLYAQRRHLISPRFQRMLWDLLRFNRLAKRLLKVAGAAPQAVSSGLHWPEEDTLAPPRVETLGEFLARERFSSAFRDHYLLPMAAAIWSCPCQTMLEFPALSLMRFFYNHGLLEITNRPAWRTVTGGSRCYVEKILTALGEAARLQAKAVKIVRRPQGVTVVLEKGGQEQFDQVVIATHADEALTLLADPEPLERRLLSAFRYQQNRALLHTDPVLMPKRRRLWASWNYLARQGSDAAHFIPGVSVTYWMNRLQDLADDTDYFVSLNPLQEPAPGRVIKEVSYAHPVFDEQAMAAQRYLSKIQGQGKVWFAGSYFGYGFHEDGLRSAMAVAAALGVAAPWQEPRRNLPEREANPRRAVADPTADVIVPFLS